MFRLFKLKRILMLVIYLIGRRKSKDFRVYEIKEESMAPHLLPGDYVFAKLTKDNPVRGDVIIFENKEKNFEVVKRVIGLPEEKISSKDGLLYIDGEIFDDKWGKEVTSDFAEVQIEAGEVFVLGDNRNSSTSDSRILGNITWGNCYQVIYRYWPLENLGQI